LLIYFIKAGIYLGAVSCYLFQSFSLKSFFPRTVRSFLWSLCPFRKKWIYSKKDFHFYQGYYCKTRSPVFI